MNDCIVTFWTGAYLTVQETQDQKPERSAPSVPSIKPSRQTYHGGQVLQPIGHLQVSHPSPSLELASSLRQSCSHANPGCSCSGFIGWTCFTIVPLSSSQFMRKLFGLFGPKRCVRGVQGGAFAGRGTAVTLLTCDCRSNVSCSVWIPPLDDAPHCGVRKKHSTPKTNTLCNLFRRSGLVPAGPWPEAWEGQIPFTYKRPDIA